MDVQVFKFGGSSIKDVSRIKNIKEIIKGHRQDKLVIVISAMGKTTNALEQVYHSYLINEEQGLKELDKLMEEHLVVAEGLDLDRSKLEKKMTKYIIENLSQAAAVEDKDAIYDQIISLGELFSTTLVKAYLDAKDLQVKWLDVRAVIRTDENHREGKVDLTNSSNRIKKKLKKYFTEADVVVTQGFLGKTESGMTTTLGREGSDYTAAIFAYALDVDELTIWKDVPGILTADPRRFNNVELLENLSYKEAIEMTYYGAKVIHPKTIQPIQKKNIQLKVRSFLDTDNQGTLISDKGRLNYPPIVVIQDEVILLQIATKDFSFIAEDHMRIIFDQLAKHKVKTSVMKNSAISFTLCINHLSTEKLEAFLASLGQELSVEVLTDLQLITVRHFQESLVQSLTDNKVVLFEESAKDTIQLVVKPALQLSEKN